MAAPTTPATDRRWLILGVCAVAQLMVVLDVTIVNIALPSAQKALGFANDDRQWIITAYALAFGSLLLLGGRLGDLFGRKWALIIGLAGFAGASAIGGASQSFAMLVSARALQGVFGAILAPSALGTLTTTFADPAERGKAFGIFGAVAGGGSAVGLVLGGILTETLSWRWCLYVNLVFAIIAGVGAFLLLENPPRGERPHLDIPGTILASGGLFCIVYGFSHAETAGWLTAVTLGFLAGGVALLLAFVILQRRAAHPLLPLKVVLDRVRGGAYLSVGLSAIAIFAVFLFLTFYLQSIRGYSPIRNGLAFLPLSVAIVTSSTTSNIKLYARFGPRRLVAPGMVLGGIGMAGLSRIGLHSNYAAGILPWLIVLGLGFGLIFAPAINGATSGVERADAGVASAMVNTMQQVGGSVGTALLSTIAAGAATRYVLAHHGPTPTTSALGAVHGYTVAFLCSSAIFFGAAIICGLILPAGRTQAAAAEPALA